MKKKYFFLAITLIMIASAIQISCNKGSSSYNNPAPPPPSGSSGVEITMYHMAFSPKSKTVANGTVVTWRNGDSYAHTVTSNDASSFSSGSITGGGTFVYTATVPGTYEYHCTIHGISMSGTLIVSP